METDTTLLLIDDNRGDAALLREALAEVQGVSLKVASTGYEALEMLCDGVWPRLILLDLGLPDLHGLDVLKSLKENPRTRRLPVIVFSNISPSEADRAYDLHANSCVRKPHAYEDLKATLKAIVTFWLGSVHLP
jgi:two-component system, chemotaxis family, response regulator Rcp1